MNSVRGPVPLPTSSSQTKKTNPTIAGHRPIAAGYSATDQPSNPTARSADAPRSWIVVNGSIQCQTGPTNADSIATPTQPYTHRNSVVTSPALVPPAMPWATTQIQPISPMARSG